MSKKKVPQLPQSFQFTCLTNWTTVNNSLCNNLVPA